MDLDYSRTVDSFGGMQLEQESIDYGDGRTDRTYRIQGDNGSIVASMTVRMGPDESLQNASEYDVSGELTPEEFMDKWSSIRSDLKNQQEQEMLEPALESRGA